MNHDLYMHLAGNLNAKLFQVRCSVHMKGRSLSAIVFMFFLLCFDFFFSVP